MLDHRAWRKHDKKKPYLTKNLHIYIYMQYANVFYVKSHIILKLAEVKSVTLHITETHLVRKVL